MHPPAMLPTSWHGYGLYSSAGSGDAAPGLTSQAVSEPLGKRLATPSVRQAGLAASTPRPAAAAERPMELRPFSLDAGSLVICLNG